MSKTQKKNKMSLNRSGGGTRIAYVDALKGFAALCVVLGHVVAGYLNGNTYPEANQLLFGIYNIIYSFHMPLFMMISGYVYAVSYFDNEGVPNHERIHRQIGNILIIYVLFSVLFGLTKIMFGSYTNKSVSLKDILLIWGKPIDLYWYLYDLVLLYLLFCAAIFRKANRRIVICVLAAAAVLSRYVSFGWFQISSVLYYVLFFYIGFLEKYYPKWLIGNKWVTLGMVSVSVVLSVILWDKRTYIGKKSAVFLNSIPVANVLIAGGISLMLWYLFRRARCFCENKFLMLLGRYNLEIYLLHCFFTAGFRAVFHKFGLENSLVSVVLNFALSTAIPIMMAMVCKRLEIHELLFKPMNFINKKGKHWEREDARS